MNCSFWLQDSKCGSTAYAPNEQSIIPLEACRKYLSGYLTNLGVSGSRGRGTGNIPTEYEIILNRAGIYSPSKVVREKMTVCPKHRYELTTHYQRLPSRCSYPVHKGERKTLKNPRCVNKKVSEEIFSLFHVKVPIGSGKLNHCALNCGCLILTCYYSL